MLSEQAKRKKRKELLERSGRTQNEKNGLKRRIGHDVVAN